MWFHCFSPCNITHNLLNKSMCQNCLVAKWQAWLTSFSMELAWWIANKITMPLTLFRHSISYDDFTCHRRITYILLFVTKACFEKEQYLLSVVLQQHVMLLARQKKCYLLSVINSMKFVETLFQIIVYHQLSVVHCIMSDKLHKHQCCLLSLNRSDMGEAMLYYSLPVHERLDWQVCLQW